MKLTGAQTEALRIAANRRKGLISAGHGFPTAKATLVSMRKLGLVDFVASDPTYYAQRYQYRVTQAGRDTAQSDTE